MMNKLLFVCLLILASECVQAQNSTKIFSWENALKANPDSVFAIDASKLKWTEIPEDLKKFKLLRYLNLSKNKLVSLPDFIADLMELKTIDLTKNEFISFPIQLCKMKQLQKIHLSRNKIDMIPTCIGYISELRVLDLWDNPINSLPDELMNLKKLTAVDMRGIMLSADFQNKWIKKMPEVKWFFDSPCHCID